MKLKAEIIVLASKIQNLLEEEEKSLISFQKTYGTEYTKPKIKKIIVVTEHKTIKTANWFGKKCDQVVQYFKEIIP